MHYLEKCLCIVTRVYVKAHFFLISSYQQEHADRCQCGESYGEPSHRANQCQSRLISGKRQV